MDLSWKPVSASGAPGRNGVQKRNVDLCRFYFPLSKRNKSLNFASFWVLKSTLSNHMMTRFENSYSFCKYIYRWKHYCSFLLFSLAHELEDNFDVMIFLSDSVLI